MCKGTANDVKESEEIVFSCSTCRVEKVENARKFFEKVPSLMLLPKMTCKKCGTTITVEIRDVDNN